MKDFDWGRMLDASIVSLQKNYGLLLLALLVLACVYLLCKFFTNGIKELEIECQKEISPYDFVVIEVPIVRQKQSISSKYRNNYGQPILDFGRSRKRRKKKKAKK